MRATPLVRRMSVVLGDDVIRARVAANLRSVSILVLDSVIGAGEGDLAGGLHLGGIRGAGAVALGGGRPSRRERRRGTWKLPGRRPYPRSRRTRRSREPRRVGSGGSRWGGSPGQSEPRRELRTGWGQPWWPRRWAQPRESGASRSCRRPGWRGRSDESGDCQGVSCDDHEPNRTGKYEGRILFR